MEEQTKTKLKKKEKRRILKKIEQKSRKRIIKTETHKGGKDEQNEKLI
jgi:hypothetical protein